MPAGSIRRQKMHKFEFSASNPVQKGSNSAGFGSRVMRDKLVCKSYAHEMLQREDCPPDVVFLPDQANTCCLTQANQYSAARKELADCPSVRQI